MKLRLLDCEVGMGQHLIAKIENLLMECNEVGRQLRCGKLAASVGSVRAGVRPRILNKGESKCRSVKRGRLLDCAEVLKNAPRTVEAFDAFDVVDKVFFGWSHRESPNDPKLSDCGGRRAGCGKVAGAGWAQVAGWSAAASVGSTGFLRQGNSCKNSEVIGVS